MALIGVLVNFQPLTTIQSAQVNANFSALQTAFNNSAVLTDLAKTITVTHQWNASQTFTGGFTTGAVVSLGAGLTFGTDNAFDVGAAGASRPRNVYVANAVTAGGAIYCATLAGTLTTAAQPNIASTGPLSVVGALSVGGVVSISGSISFGTDNAYDIGAGGAGRPRYVYIANSLVCGVDPGGSTPFRFGGHITTNGFLALKLTSTGADYGYVGVAQTAGGLVNDAAQGDLIIRSQSASIRFSADSGATTRLKIGAAVIAYGIANATALQVVGPTTAGQSYGLYIAAGTNSSDSLINACDAAGTSRFHIQGDGNSFFRGNVQWDVDNAYDIGASSSSRPRNIYAAGSIFSASSRELKEQIAPTETNALELVRATRIVDFRYKASPDVRKIGFIAEDADELLSGAERKDFDLNNAIGLLMRAVQQLDEKIDRQAKAA